MGGNNVVHGFFLPEEGGVQSVRLDQVVQPKIKKFSLEDVDLDIELDVWRVGGGDDPYRLQNFFGGPIWMCVDIVLKSEEILHSV